MGQVGRDRRRYASRDLALAGRLMTTALAERLRPLGLAPAQFLVLRELWEVPALTQRDLAARAGVEQATMAATLNRMERDGLIARDPHPSDQRARIIRPTARAAELEAPALAVAHALDRETMGALDPEARTILARLLNRLLDGLQRA